jgi:hypothetical protein
MINNLSVLSSPAANSADFSVTTKGKLNVTGLPQINVGSITNIEVVPASAEQIKKLQVTLTAQNAAAYIATISGYAMSNGNSVDKTISFTSADSASLTSVSLQMITAINKLSDFNVTATNAAGGVTGDAGGIVILTAKAATTSCTNAPTFSFLENDAKIALTADAAITVTAAPTGGVDAVLEPVINASGVMTGIRIIDGGSGYVVAPTLGGFTSGGGSGSSAPSATAVIFEGSVVAINFTAGTTYTYTTYKGFLAVGTGLALKQKYGFVGPAIQRATPLAFGALANLVDASSYTEIVISYNDAQISGTTNSVSTVATLQASLCVLEGSTNSADILSLAYGSVVNLRKGYRAVYESIVDSSNAAVNITSTSYVATATNAVNEIKSADILLVGAATAFPSTATNGVALICGRVTAATFSIQVGGPMSATNFTSSPARLVKRSPIVG